MDANEKNNEEKERGEQEPGAAFRDMREMMKNCCGDAGMPFDCCSMMAGLMGPRKGGDTGGDQKAEGKAKGS